MDFLGFLITQCLNAMSQASVLLFLTCGLTLIFGIMRIINFAHGAICMPGAYVGHIVVVLAIVLPEVLTGVVFLLDQPFPIYRLFLIGLGVSASVALWQFLERTRAGLLIRAVSQNPEIVHVLGIDIRIVRTGVFALGCGFAALGGILATPFFGAYLAMGNNVVVDAYVIVIIGGMGSFLGSVIGSIMVGFVPVFGASYFPSIALSLLYLLILTVFIVRPGGLLCKEE